jgi:hypothetical protein
MYKGDESIVDTECVMEVTCSFETSILSGLHGVVYLKIQFFLKGNAFKSSHVIQLNSFMKLFELYVSAPT